MRIKREISASRSVAFDLLRSVTAKKKSFDDAMNRHDGFQKLSGRDRRFVRKIVTTALRRLGQIDLLLDRFLKKPLPKNATVVQDILRVAVTEILFLKFPPHAAVDSAVTLVGSRRFPKLKGLRAFQEVQIPRDLKQLLNHIPWPSQTHRLLQGR